MRIPFTICGFRLQFTESAYNLRISLTSCGFHLQLWILRQLKFTKHIYYYLLVVPRTVTISANFVADSANLPVFGGILSITVFKLFVRGIQSCKKDQRKISNVADSATILLLTYCRIRLQFTKCTVWPGNVIMCI